MNSLPIRKEDLVKYHTDEEIVNKTALQVIKDFSQFGIEINFPVDLRKAYNDLFDQLLPVIHNMFINDITRLYSLLYRIDLTESATKKGLSEMPNLPAYESITHLILERELKKVLTREYFSRHS